jgi:hypothetical protein
LEAGRGDVGGGGVGGGGYVEMLVVKVKKLEDLRWIWRRV